MPCSFSSATLWYSFTHNNMGLLFRGGRTVTVVIDGRKGRPTLISFPLLCFSHHPPFFLSFFLSRVVVRLSYYPFVSQQDIFLHVDSIFPRLITSNLTCGLIIEIHGFIGAQYLYRYLYQQDTLNLITRVMPTYQAYILCIIFKNCHLLTCHLSPYCCISTIFFSFFFFKIFVI